VAGTLADREPVEHTRDVDGSRFEPPIERPRADAKHAAEALEGSPRGTTRTVLVVEDDAGIRQVAVQILRAGGYRVLHAENGRDGVSLFRSAKGAIDVVVLDVEMPAMGGIEAFGLIQQIDPAVPVLFASGDPDSLPSEVEARASGFLPKPYGPKSLLGAVAETLRA
jgi:two-component system cell cycle sensor histidine kinase/response regulator CckA